MKFYVNELPFFSDDPGECWIGLFDSNKHKGCGSFCGYYGAEYYLQTNLLAVGVRKANFSGKYEPKIPFEHVYKVTDPYCNEIQIGSCYYEKVFEADSVEEAFIIFKNQNW